MPDSIWCERPINEKDIPQYIENIFKYAGDHDWIQVIKEFVIEDLETQIAANAAGPVEIEKD